MALSKICKVDVAGLLKEVESINDKIITLQIERKATQKILQENGKNKASKVKTL